MRGLKGHASHTAMWRRAPPGSEDERARNEHLWWWVVKKILLVWDWRRSREWSTIGGRAVHEGWHLLVEFEQ